MYNDVQNPDSLDAVTIDLTGGFRIFVPGKDTPFYNGTTKKGIHLGHVRNPAETYTPTTKKVDTGVYGALQTVKEIVTRTEETGTFETVSVKNLAIRGLWAGSKVYLSTNAPATAEPWAATTDYIVGDLVIPKTNANGHYYKVTVAGKSGNTEPTWPTDGSTVTNGSVTFGDQGLIPDDNKLAIIPRNHSSYTGMLIDVVVSVEDSTSEIYVAPNITLRGDGYGGGRNSTDETSLKFAYTILSAGAYALPVGLGFSGVSVFGGFDILGVPKGSENSIISDLIASYYA